MSERRAALIGLLMLPATYVALVIFGAGTGSAATWAPVFVAVGVAIALPRYLPTAAPQIAPPAAPLPTLVLVQQRTLLLRAGALALGVVLVESIVSSMVASVSSDPAVHDTLNTMLGLPAGMLIVRRLGRWSARHLPVPRPWVWLAAIAAASRLLRLLLYAATMPGQQFGYVLVRNVMLGVLILFFLVVGYRREARTG